MAATTISRATWTDGAGGTVLNNARLQADVYDKFDAVIANNIVFGGILSAEGFGAHGISAGSAGVQSWSVRNSSAGTGNAAVVYLGNDTSATLGALAAYSSTWTTAAFQNATALVGSGAGGAVVQASHASGAVRFLANAASAVTAQIELQSTLRTLAISPGANGLGARLIISDFSTADAIAVLQSGEPGVNASYVIVGSNYRASSTGASGRVNTSIGGSFWRLGPALAELASISSGGAVSARLTMDTSGHFTPGADNTQNLGSAALRWADVRTVNFTSGDISLENGCTLTEHYKVGIDEPGVAFLNGRDEVVGFLSETGVWYTRESRDLANLAWLKTTKAERAVM